MGQTYRAGLIGAGNICEHHIRALERLPQVKLIGVTDLDAARARAAADRFRVPAVFASLEAMVVAGVDVVHVLTPPASHAAVTLRALELGCHVLVEKPLATSEEDCERIARAADKAGKIVGVDHAMLFDPFVARALHIVRSGRIGEVVSVDYTRSQAYGSYRGGPLPVHYRDGGYPFRDMGVHGLYLLEAFLGSIEDVTAQFSGRADGDPNLLYNEWHALVRGAKGAGHLHLSWNVKPFQNVLTVQGTRGQIRADLFGMSLTVRRLRRLPELIQRAVNAWSEACHTAFQVPLNIARVLTKSLRRYHGLQEFVAQFYKNLSAGKPAPVTPEKARPIVAWTERMARQADRAKAECLARLPQTLTAPVLVTGATGFIGKHLVHRLRQSGQRLRVLVRRLTHPWQDDPGVEIVLGDLGDPEAVDRAVAGVSLVYHLGAGIRGTADDCYRGTVAGTQNVVDSVLKHRVPKLVYVSSLSVLHAAAAGRQQCVDEEWPLEPHPDKRGVYTKTKLEAERIVCRAVAQRGLPAVILRPGQVFGPGGPILTPSVAQRTRRRLIILGNGKVALPLVYVDDLVDALMQAPERDVFNGSVFHVVDATTLTQNELVEEYLHSTREPLKILRLPRLLVYTLALGVQTLAKLLRRAAPLSIYRVRSALGGSIFDCRAAQEHLGWQPRIGVRRGLQTTLATLQP